MTGWLEPLTAAIAESGTDPGSAPAAARLSMAVTRGLLPDLLATQATKGVTEVFELLLQPGAVTTTERDSRWPRGRRRLQAPRSPGSALLDSTTMDSPIRYRTAVRAPG